ncbi:tetratricopeptide repeat protein [Variovorax ginsengisoli]|uniref:TolB-like protein/Tfp pilus assembly protein PilF n=1 Tax=Variovorax ginsengisoli TaxID=363844 RepID=A0ABT9S2G5_9BURK|nr:tetratricopeptide repeat protein [Variovorax ginsengisoli]MDP9898415.1 TolB-like protein/Tfp pilus assembly protein PilF [Variovorax ginsengisoli]
MAPSEITSLYLQEERINAAVHALLQSETFRRATRMRQLLQYLVAETLAGRGERLKQFNIAVEAFGYGSDFDPQVLTSVRTEAYRLRSRLEYYYRTEGATDPLKISVPKGGFMPTFEPRKPSMMATEARAVARIESPPRLLIVPITGLNIADADMLAAFHDEISLHMASLPLVAVLSRSTSSKLRQAGDGLRQAASESQAAYVMEGSLFRQDRTYRLIVRIVDPQQDVVVWSNRHEQHVEDMIAFQRQVAADVAGSVRSWLDSAMAPRRVFSDSLLLREYLRSAIRDRTDGELVALGLGHLTSGGTADATSVFNEAIMSSPDEGLQHTAMGLCHLQSGRLQEAHSAAERGIELAPDSAFAHSSLAAICLHMRDFDGAIMFAQKSVALAPEFDAVKLLLGDCYLYAGFHKTAITQLEEARHLMHEHPAALAHLGYAYARTGQQGKARRLLRMLQDGADSADGPNAAAMTLIHTGLGEVEQAFEWLNRTLMSRPHSQQLLLLSSPAYDSLRAYPRFNALAGRAHVV